MSICVISKDSEYERSQYLQTDELDMCYLRPKDEIKLLNFKETLTLIIKGDIELYNRLYEKSNNTYYLGRIQECRFLLKIVKGKIDDEIGEC